MAENTLMTARLSQPDKLHVLQVYSAFNLKQEIEEEIRKHMKEAAVGEKRPESVFDALASEIANFSTRILADLFKDPVATLPNLFTMRLVVGEMVIRIVKMMSATMARYAKELQRTCMNRGDYMCLLREAYVKVLIASEIYYYIIVSLPAFVFNKMVHGIVPLIAANRYVESMVTGIYATPVRGAVPWTGAPEQEEKKK